MTKFLSIDRVITDRPRAARLLAFIEQIAAFQAVNELMEECAHKPLDQVLEQLERLGGRYRIEPDLPPRVGPTVHFANHPVGGADSVAAMRILEAGGGGFRLLASRAVEPTPSVAEHVVRVDPSGTDRKLNVQSLGHISRGLGREFSQVFVFPAGLCSRLDLPRPIVTDPPWTASFVRIALRANADLAPVWFSGHNSPLYYLLCMVMGRLGTVALPSEFFRPKREPLLARRGTPIPAKGLSFFGDQTLSGLRAAVYSLAERSCTVRPSGPPPRSTDRNGAVRPVNVQLLLASDADRDSITAFRDQCGGAAQWSRADEVALHLVARGVDGLSGYCRVFDWSGLGAVELSRSSGVHLAYRVDPGLCRGQRIVGFDQLFLSGVDDPSALLQRMWAKLQEQVSPRLAIGVITIPSQNPMLAAAQFEFARRTSPSAHDRHFAARRSLVAPSPHHGFKPELIAYEQPPSPDDLPPVLQALLALGAGFGRSAATDDGAAVLVSLTAN